jgi:hypothetical protein
MRNGEPIPGATNSNYAVLQSDRGNSLTLKVTGTKPGYEDAVKISSAKKIS